MIKESKALIMIKSMLNQVKDSKINKSHGIHVKTMNSMNEVMRGVKAIKWEQSSNQSQKWETWFLKFEVSKNLHWWLETSIRVWVLYWKSWPLQRVKWLLSRESLILRVLVGSCDFCCSLSWVERLRTLGLSN